MKITKTEAIQYEYNFTLDEQQALILLKILSSIAGKSQWRDEFINPMLEELCNLIGREKYDNFSQLNSGRVDSRLFLAY